jgi:ribosome-associated heat shock protein Hsp15
LATQRLDRWLFFARAVKSRTLAQKLIETGTVRVNAVRTRRTDHQVGTGDVLTMIVHDHLRVWKILDSGERRGPASEAQKLYADLSPPPLPREPPALALAARDPGAGRPTKKQRRATERLVDGES